MFLFLQRYLEVSLGSVGDPQYGALVRSMTLPYFAWSLCFTLRF